MRILIWGGDSWANQGDAAILAGTLASLRAALPDAAVTVASDTPDTTAQQQHVAAVRRGSVRFLATLWRADIVLWGGGQLLQNESSKVFLLVQWLFLGLALLLRKPVVCYAQGVGGINGGISRWVTRFLLARLSQVSVRDRFSAQRLIELGLPAAAVRVTADPSFSLTASSKEDVAALRKRLGLTGRFLVVAVRRWGHYRGGWLPLRLSRRPQAAQDSWFHSFCDSVAAAADHLVSAHGVQVLFLPMCPGGDQQDELVARQVRDRMLYPQQTTVLEEWLPSALLKGLLGEAELVVAMRTHAGMLAAAAGTPVVSLSYQGKGEALMQELGLGEYALPVEQVTKAELIGLLERAWQNRDAVRAQLGRAVPGLVARSAESAHWLAARWSRQRREVRLGSAYRALLLSALGLHPSGPRVLDVGAADGRLLEQLGAVQGVALDVQPETADARAVAFVRGDGTAAPFADGAFDTVIAFDVLEHVEDDTGMADELLRLVQPGGALWVSVPSRKTAIFPPWLTPWAHREWGHLRPGYTRQELGLLFQSGGEHSLKTWNEPVYRGSYLILKALSLVWPVAALALLRVVARLDGRLRHGEAGHYFLIVRVPAAANVARAESAPEVSLSR